MNSRKLINVLLPAFLAAFALSGCITAKKLAYLRDMEYNNPYSALKAPELKIQPEDRLEIAVGSELPELAAPFNTGLSDGEGSAQKSLKYTVDADGCIVFPVLGTLQVAGKTVRQIEKDIENKISARGDIKEPKVMVRLDNFKITVIGSMTNSVLEVEEPSINILQAIARSGGITDRSNVKDVMVIRTDNGQRKAYQINLQEEKSVFESPVFFLQQNDVVYVKHKGTYLSPTGQSVVTFLSAILSFGGIITNIILWTNR